MSSPVDRNAIVLRALACVDGLVDKFARSYVGMFDADEAASQANLAVVEVARRHDRAKDDTFDAYVRSWARGFLLKLVTCRTVERKMDRAARLAAESVRATFRAGEALRATDGGAAARGALNEHAEDQAVAIFVAVTEAKRRAAAAEHPEAAYEDAEEMEMLREAMKELPHDERVIIEALFFEGMQKNELPALLNVSEGTVARRFTRAMRRLKKALKRLGMTKMPQLHGTTLSKPVLRGIPGGRSDGGGASGRGPSRGGGGKKR